MKNHCSVPQIDFFLILIFSALPLGNLSRFIRVCDVLSEQAYGPVRFCAELSARANAQHMPVTSSNSIVSTLATAARPDMSPTAQTERASMSCFIQVSKELAPFNNFLSLSHEIKNHSLSLL